MELADTPDLGSSVYPQNLIGLSGYGGIGRRVRFRFLCHMACGFKSHWPHKIRLFVKWVILQGALFFCAFLEFDKYGGNGNLGFDSNFDSSLYFLWLLRVEKKRYNMEYHKWTMDKPH